MRLVIRNTIDTIGNQKQLIIWRCIENFGFHKGQTQTTMAHIADITSNATLSDPSNDHSGRSGINFGRSYIF